MSARQDNLHEEVRLFGRTLLTKTAKMGIPLYITSGFRDRALQSELYVKGLDTSPPRGSPFEYGCAIRIGHSAIGSIMPAMCWEIIGHIAEEICRQKGFRIEWGELYDPSYFALTDWFEKVPCMPAMARAG